MPLPKPKTGEKEDKFISRCMSALKDEFPDQKQRLAVCYSQWRKPKEKKYMKKELERRYIPYKFTELRADDEKGVIYGYGARFNVWSSQLGYFKEKIRPGAFAKTIQENDIRSLFNHDANYVLGRTKNKTLRLWEDEKGLGFEAALPDTSYAKDLLTNIRRKNITQNSFGFETVQDEWSKKGDKRELVEVKLYDVGPVTFPAYPQTSVQARNVLNDIGIDYDALCRVFVKQSRGVELTDSDNDLLVSTLGVLRSYLPEDEPDHSEEAEPVESSEDSTEPDLLLRQATLALKTKIRARL